MTPLKKKTTNRKRRSRKKTRSKECSPPSKHGVAGNEGLDLRAKRPSGLDLAYRKGLSSRAATPHGAFPACWGDVRPSRAQHKPPRNRVGELPTVQRGLTNALLARVFVAPVAAPSERMHKEGVIRCDAPRLLPN